ncbi:MAG: pirin family protein [Alphaproteobacteria bacterium]|nr:pirin family protein [Alphaproteobacteria bacterium]
MSVTLRPSGERGHASHGWLDTYHTFSFADYHDLKHMGFRDLRVINDDVIEGGAGFPPHGHRDMEIITYMVEGALAHKDSTGGEGVIKRGDVQTMTAGSGVRHSEFNGSPSEKARLLQIWIMPAANGLAPGYQQTAFSDDDKRNVLRMIAGDNPEKGALPIHQDARIYASLLDEGKSLSHELKPGRAAWVQMIAGELDINGTVMKPGDGAAIEDTGMLTLAARKNSEFLLFDLN